MRSRTCGARRSSRAGELRRAPFDPRWGLRGWATSSPSRRGGAASAGSQSTADGVTRHGHTHVDRAGDQGVERLALVEHEFETTSAGCGAPGAGGWGRPVRPGRDAGPATGVPRGSLAGRRDGLLEWDVLSVAMSSVRGRRDRRSGVPATSADRVTDLTDRLNRTELVGARSREGVEVGPRSDFPSVH